LNQRFNLAIKRNLTLPAPERITSDMTCFQQLSFSNGSLHDYFPEHDITGQSCCPLGSNLFTLLDLPARAQIGPVMSQKTSQPADISMLYRCGKGWPVFFNFGGVIPLCGNM
jgi:hypothetical protein